MAEETIYRGVKIVVIAGNPERRQRGRFTLSWQGHEPEEVASTGYLAPYVLEEAKTFVDEWIDQRYIQGGGEASSASGRSSGEEGDPIL